MKLIRLSVGCGACQCVSALTLALPLSRPVFQNGQTPLMVAAEQGNLEIVQELIRRGANVNLDDVVRAHPYTH